MTTESKHTPGPWRHATSGNMGNLIEGPCGKVLYEEDNGYRTVASVQACCASDKYADQEANRQANIALIAAAPELLEALEAFAAHFGPLHDNEWLNDEVRRCFSLARTAIRKAKGEA